MQPEIQRIKYEFQRWAIKTFVIKLRRNKHKNFQNINNWYDVTHVRNFVEEKKVTEPEGAAAQDPKNVQEGREVPLRNVIF